MKILLTGSQGMLGHDIYYELQKRNIEIIATDIKDNLFEYDCYIKCDLTKENEVEDLFSRFDIDRVIHCAAWTMVDAAEDEDKKGLVYDINVKATQNIAKACKKNSSKMMYISTDYVFKGDGIMPFEPDSKDFSPMCEYGRTKLLGEFEVEKYLKEFFIVRTSWVFGAFGPSFIKTMINVSKNHDSVRVVNDQIGTPTYTKDLARLLCDMIESDKYGFYHATNEGGYISWYDFCKEIYKECNIKTIVNPVSSEEYGLSKAIRPKNSRLDKSKLVKMGFVPLPTWQDALKRFLEESKLK